jgi:lysyl-tRNA synthetase class 2
MASIEELRSTRLAKLEILKKYGMNPYPSKVPRTFCLADAKANFSEYEKDKKEISLAGRIMAIRAHGGGDDHKEDKGHGDKGGHH